MHALTDVLKLGDSTGPYSTPVSVSLSLFSFLFCADCAQVHIQKYRFLITKGEDAINLLKEFYAKGNPNAPDDKRQRPLLARETPIATTTATTTTTTSTSTLETNDESHDDSTTAENHQTKLSSTNSDTVGLEPCSDRPLKREGVAEVAADASSGHSGMTPPAGKKCRVE